MAFRGGLGPVFAYEWLTATRRWQMYAWRNAFVGTLLLGLIVVWGSRVEEQNVSSIKQQAEIAQSFYHSLIGLELFMVLLAAPAATAGAICLDKARGTLFHVLVTDLSDSEIVLGKLAARLTPVLGLIAGCLPVMALTTLMGGIDPVALSGSSLVIAAMGVLGCSLSLCLSVWGKKIHEVLLAMYSVWILWIVILPLSLSIPTGTPPTWVGWTNPFVLCLASHDPSQADSPGLGVQILFSAGALLVSAALLAVTVRRLRPVVIGQWGQAERAARPWWPFARRRSAKNEGSPATRKWPWRSPLPSPTLDGNPVLWREWQRRRPSRWGRVIWGLYGVLAAGFSGLAVCFWMMSAPGYREFPIMVNLIQATTGLLLLSVTSATSLAEERARGSLDVLLVTPLPTSSIVWGKWWGAFRGVLLLAILPTLLCLLLASDQGLWAVPFLMLGMIIAHGAALISLGLALATWIPQLGRVLGISVATFVAVSIGWIALVILVVPRGIGHNHLVLAAIMGSPPYGVGMLTGILVEPRAGSNLWPGCAYGALFWTVEYSVIAGSLLIATLFTFDRCFGRMPDHTARPRPAVAKLTMKKPEAAMLLE